MRDTYHVEPRPQQRGPYRQPEEWVIKKGNTVIETFDIKLDARDRAIQLARNQEETLSVFDAEMKGSEHFDFRPQGEIDRQRDRAMRNRLRADISNMSRGQDRPPRF